MRVFEKRVLRRIFGPRRDEVTGKWKKLHIEEFHILFLSPNIIRHIKSMRMRWVGHVACMGEESVQCFGGKVRRNSFHLEVQGVDGRMGSEWILGRLVGGV
jgi:hypothetical protein